MAAELGTTKKYRRTLELLYRRSGVKQRHSVVLEEAHAADAPRQSFYKSADSAEFYGPSTAQRMQRYEQEAAALAESACVAALEASGDPAESITHLVTVSCSGFVAPGVDLTLCNHLRLPRHVERLHVGFMGCHGLLIGLRTARGLIAAEPSARVLLCSVELCSLHHQYTDDPQQLVANALFSDGAAAMVLCEERFSSPGSWNLVSHASTVILDTADMMSWRIGDHGFQMSLSPEVPSIIQRELAPWISAWLQKVGYEIGDIRNWAIHPGGPRILAATGEALQLSPQQLAPSQEILENYGNMSSPTVLFILERIGQLLDPSPCVMLAFGPGLSIEAALLARCQPSVAGCLR